MATKQDVLNEITDILGLNRWIIDRPGVKAGSSLPSHVFKAAAAQTGVEYTSMPAANEAMIRKAGLPFKASYDSRASDSAGGSTVTLDGVKALRDALTILVRPVPVHLGVLLTWNPRRWDWPSDELAAAVDATAAGQIVKGRWSTGIRTSGIKIGDPVYLLRQGVNDRGIVASGTARSEVFQDEHYADPAKTGNYIEVDWEMVVDPSEVLPIETLQAQVPIGHFWRPQGSGTALSKPIRDEVQRLWTDHLAGLQKKGAKTGEVVSGQARLLDAVRRKAVEDAAQNWLMKVYRDAGWVVQDTHIGNPFDARATKNGKVLYLEAKGTQTAGATVIVTRNEVGHALDHPGQNVIGIWSGIRLGADGKVDPKSGTKTIRMWDPKQEDLSPISYDWKVVGKVASP